MFRSVMDEGGVRLAHARFRIEDAVIMATGDYPELPTGVTSPEALGGTAVTIRLELSSRETVDGIFERAVKCGAEILDPPVIKPWNEYYGRLKDPFGHVWAFGAPPDYRAPKRSLAQPLQVFDGFLRFRPMRVVGIDIRGADHATGVDYVARRHRQRPAVFAVVFGQIDTDAEIDVTQFGGHLKGQSELVRIGVTRISEKVEFQLVPFGHGEAVFSQLRRQRDDRRSGTLDFVCDFLQSVQLRIAVGSPAAPEDRQYDRPPCQQIG